MGEETTVEDGEGAGAPRGKPTILVPPRGSMESLFTNGSMGLGFSHGPMTLVSSFFLEQGPFSFSQLLAGDLASPIKPGFWMTGVEEEEKGIIDCSDNDGKINSESGGGGYKQNRPVDLLVAQPQLQFMVPAGLSPSGLLNSPVFLPPLHIRFSI